MRFCGTFWGVIRLDHNSDVHEVSREEGRALFDKTARKLLGISGDEFLARWDRGDFDREPEAEAVARVAMLIPFAR